MRCHELREQLSAYIDGMLDSSLVEQVEEHIASCAECRTEYEDLKAAVEMVRELPEVVPPPEFHANLRQRLRDFNVIPAVNSEQSIGKQGPVWKKWSRPLAAAAVIFLTVGVTVLWYDKHNGGILDPVFQENQKQVERGGHRDRHAGEEVAALTAGQGKTGEKDLLVENGSKKFGPSPGGNPEPVAERTKQIAINPENRPTGDVQQDQSPEGDEPRLFIMQAPERAPGEIAGQDDRDGNQDGNSEGIQQKVKQYDPVEAGPLVAREYEVTLKTGRDDAAQLVVEMAGRHGGYVESEPQGQNQVWTFLIPADGVELFLGEIKQLGEVNYIPYYKDLNNEFEQGQDKLNELREQDMAIIKLTIK
jgi:hypothetical protein